MSQKIIYVYADFLDLKDPTAIGFLKVETIKGSEIFSFEYDNDWLLNKNPYLLDPDIGWYQGSQYLPAEKSNFGLFLDSSPDRWGQVLLKRREAHLARIQKRSIKNLQLVDYLLGVYDEQRMGALRYKLDKNGPFLDDNNEFPTPPWASLKELEHASLRIEQDEAIDSPKYLEWLNMLIAPGTSLGGARPKAGVLDGKNELWIAKFPSKSDEYDIGAWEKLTYDLAINAGLNMSESKLMKFTGIHHTFLTKRFDRINSTKRIHFASAMTLLGRTDGDNFKDGISYLDLAGFIIQNGNVNHINEDLEELWRRIVFSICVKNTDDHLRNHGFLLGEKGWRLSPTYDVNPTYYGSGLSLNISENDNSLNLDLVLEVAVYFRLDIKRAKDIITKVKNSVQNWRSIANKYAIPKIQQELMANAFEMSL